MGEALTASFHAMDDMLRSPDYERPLLQLKQALRPGAKGRAWQPRLVAPWWALQARTHQARLQDLPRMRSEVKRWTEKRHEVPKEKGKPRGVGS